MCVLIFKDHESSLLTSSALRVCVCARANRCMRTFVNTSLVCGRGLKALDAEFFFFIYFFYSQSLKSLFLFLLKVDFESKMHEGRKHVFMSPSCRDLSVSNDQVHHYVGVFVCSFMFMYSFVSG